MVNIHPSAIVSKKAQIGDNVTVGAFCIIEEDAVIQDGTEIGSNVLVSNGARIGKNCKIHKGAVIASMPQDLKYGGEKTTLEIGDETTVREFCTLNRGTVAHGRTVIGKNCLLMAYSHVAHDCIVGDRVILSNVVQLAGHVTIGDWAILGGMAGVHQFCRIGKHSMIGAQYKANQDVPPYIIAAGEPLKFSGLNSIGLRRRGFDPDVVLTLKRAYRLLYRSKLNRSHALERIKQEIQMIDPVRELIEFVESSERGII
ncbi:acyl-ACP--UDP-N-acetylglucosamine O-acyltransferase [candidate division KSB1 bacterium]|nr:acyl-ACP--UDP-N-acetylglucosamine O-acyltransferase [candidate division KSB1 bacterium]